jgi:hypothetical protein
MNQEAEDTSDAVAPSSEEPPNGSTSTKHRILASVPVNLLDMSVDHLQEPVLARLDKTAQHLLVYLPTPSTADKGAVDQTLKGFARDVISANKGNMKKGRLQRELPYWTVFVMNLILFGVGLVAFSAAVVRGLSGDPVSTATFGGITISAIVSTFLLNPITSLQKSNLLNTGLVCVINTYWDRLLYLEDPNTIDQDLARVTQETLSSIELLRKGYLSKDPAWANTNNSGS